MHHQHAADFAGAGQQRGRLGQLDRVVGAHIDDVVGRRGHADAGRRAGGKGAGQEGADDLACFLRQGGQAQPVAQGGVGAELRRADGIGDDGERFAAGRPGAGEGFRRGQKVFQARHDQGAAAPQGGDQGGVGAAGGIEQQAAGADGNHRAQPGGGAGGREEDAAVLDPADVEQDGAGARIARQPVEHDAEADIGVGAEADDVAETNPVRLGPVQHGAAHGR